MPPLALFMYVGTFHVGRIKLHKMKFLQLFADTHVAGEHKFDNIAVGFRDEHVQRCSQKTNIVLLARGSPRADEIDVQRLKTTHFRRFVCLFGSVLISPTSETFRPLGMPDEREKSRRSHRRSDRDRSDRRDRDRDRDRYSSRRDRDRDDRRVSPVVLCVSRIVLLVSGAVHPQNSAI